MLSKPSTEALIALDQVSKLPRCRDIHEMIEAELRTILDKIMGARDTADLHELRGRAKAFREFQTELREAGGTLAKMGIKSPIA